jgi:hypothetical protein
MAGEVTLYDIVFSCPITEPIYVEFVIEGTGTSGSRGYSLGIKGDVTGKYGVCNGRAASDTSAPHPGLWTANVASTDIQYEYTTSDVIGVAWDPDNLKLWIAKNNTWFGSGNPAAGTSPLFTVPSGETYTLLCQFYKELTTPAGTKVVTLNNELTQYVYTPPTGFSAPSPHA